MDRGDNRQDFACLQLFMASKACVIIKLLLLCAEKCVLGVKILFLIVVGGQKLKIRINGGRGSEISMPNL